MGVFHGEDSLGGDVSTYLSSNLNKFKFGDFRVSDNFCAELESICLIHWKYPRTASVNAIVKFINGHVKSKMIIEELLNQKLSSPEFTFKPEDEFVIDYRSLDLDKTDLRENVPAGSFYFACANKEDLGKTENEILANSNVW